MTTIGNVAILLHNFFFSSFLFAFLVAGEEKTMPKVTKVEMSMEEGFRIYQHWTDQALTSLMSAFLQAKMNAKELPSTLPDPFSKCYLQSKSVPAMAKCISRLLNGQFEEKIIIPKKRIERYKKGTKKKEKTENLWIGQFQVENGENEGGGAMRRMGKSTMADGGRENGGRMFGGKFGKKPEMFPSIRLEKLKLKRTEKLVDSFPKRRFRRKTLKRKKEGEEDEDDGLYGGVENVERRNYSLIEARRTVGLSPIGGLARMLMANVLSKNNRTEMRPWQQTVAQIKELKKLRENAENAFLPQPSPWLREMKLNGNGRGKGNNRRLERLEKLLNLRKGGMGERPLEQQISELVRDGIRIGMKLARTANGTKEGEEEEGEGEVGLDLFSPRFLSITERKADEKSNLFSPSVFSLHNKGKGIERELSLPKLMKDSQFTGRDQQEWLNLVMEASGANRQIDEVKEFLQMTGNGSGDDNKEMGEMRREAGAKEMERRYKREFDGLYLSKENVGIEFKRIYSKWQIREICGHFEERKVDTWAELNKKFTAEQKREMNETGYSILSLDQLKFIYGPSSPFNDSRALDRLLPILEANNSLAINKLIEMDIHQIAEMRSFDIRQNDIVLSPALFRPAILNPSRVSQPIILSPVVFSPTILSPSVFGVAILTPRVFSPNILSPRVMTPLIFAPFIFSPIILTPIVMQPFILSPGLLNSVILSPFVMNPMIMSSQVMHPFILSPLVMTPGIVNPSALSPLVLSPFVMDPQVLSPKAISGLFLSPYALSPVLWSPVYAYVVLLSPSWLS